MRSLRYAGALVVALALLAAVPARAQSTTNLEQAFASALTAVPAGELNVAGAFYVPAYSSVSMSQGKLRADFSVTLSIHNTSEVQAIGAQARRIL